MIVGTGSGEFGIRSSLINGSQFNTTFSNHNPSRMTTIRIVNTCRSSETERAIAGGWMAGDCTAGDCAGVEICSPSGWPQFTQNWLAESFGVLQFGQFIGLSSIAAYRKLSPYRLPIHSVAVQRSRDNQFLRLAAPCCVADISYTRKSASSSDLQLASRDLHIQAVEGYLFRDWQDRL